MVLYSSPDESGPLRQCEVLEGVRELRFDASEVTVENIDNDAPPAVRVFHPWTIVLSPDCDLEWDFFSRQSTASSTSKLISHILLCDLGDEATVRQVVNSQKDFQRAKENREERFHHIASSKTDDGHPIGEFFIDFKGMFSIPTDYLYHVIGLGIATRHGVLIPPWAQHLTDRFTYYLGRVGLPDLE